MPDPLFDYALRYSTPEDSLLEHLSRETHLKTVYPNMLSGPLQGNLLYMISSMIRPFRILEIGTFTGYSGICLARGLAPEGILHTIDINDETYDFAAHYFALAGLSDRVVQHTGNALSVVPTLQDSFDLVFLDGDKEEYTEYYRVVFDKVKPGGFILADNVLWGGKVISPDRYKDKETMGILDFNEQVRQDTRVEKVIIPLRDGLCLIRKKTG